MMLRSGHPLLTVAALAACAALALPSGAAVAYEDPTPLTLTITLAPADAATLGKAPTRALNATERLLRLRRAAPTRSADAHVRSWFAAQGFSVTAGDGWTFQVTAPASLAARTFDTDLTRVDGAWQSDRAATLPAALVGRVQSVIGLDTTARLDHHVHLDRSMFIDGGDLRSAYSAPAGPTSAGEGTTIASVQFAGWDRTNLCSFVSGSDAPTYNHSLPLPQFSDRPTLCGAGAGGAVIEQRAVGGFDPQVRDPRSGSESLEVALDQEALLSVAPHANQRIYFAQNNATGWVDAFSQLASDAEADVAAARPTVVAVSVSWGMCEAAYGRNGTSDPIPAWEQQLQRITALGIPVFAATGDAGSYDCSTTIGATPAVDYPASSPSVIAVGGTHLAESSPGAGDWSETAWGPAIRTTTHPLVASGGGASSRFAAPGYQLAIGSRSAHRTVPDIASSADGRLGFLIYGSTWRQCGATIRWCGAWLSAGGTSSGPPVQAGLFASAMSTFGAVHPNVGSLHDVLYGNPDAVRDIVGGTGGRSLATRGYDLVTGLGVPIWSAVLQRMAEPAVEMPVASASSTVPIRVVDLAAVSISGYSVAEDLTSCPAAPDTVSAPTALTLADGPDRAAHVGVCVFHDGTSTFVSRVVSLDRTVPVAAPRLRIRLSSSVQARWDANDAGGSGAVSYTVSIRRASDGALVWQGLRELPYLSLRFAPGSSYTVRASATDAAGNVGPTVTSRVTAVPYDDTAATARGPWSRVKDAVSYDHSYTKSATRGASLTRVVNGRSVSALVHTAPDGGTLRAFVDGRLIRTISLFSATTHRDVTVPLAGFSRVGQHTVALVVTGYRPPGSRGAVARIDGIAVG